MQWKWKACWFKVSTLHSFDETFAREVTCIADTPGDSALLARGTGLVGLTVNAQVHDVVAADGAVVDHDVPRPESDGVPLSPCCQYTESLAACSTYVPTYLLHLEPLLVPQISTCARLAALHLRCRRS